jgi:hypothetical protein
VWEGPALGKRQNVTAAKDAPHPRLTARTADGRFRPRAATEADAQNSVLARRTSAKKGKTMSNPKIGDAKLQNQLEQVRDKLTETGSAATATAITVKDDVLAGLADAKDRAVELADGLPRTPDEFKLAADQIMASIKRNPAPWIAGAATVLLIWAFGRRSR